jgi:hypothetical protein
MASTTASRPQKTSFRRREHAEHAPRSESRATGSRWRNVADSPFQTPFTSREYRRRSTSEPRRENDSGDRDRSIDDGKEDGGEERSRGRVGHAVQQLCDRMIFYSATKQSASATNISLAPSTSLAGEANPTSKPDSRLAPDLQSFKLEVRLKEKHVELWDMVET